jgi:hypothetical protein
LARVTCSFKIVASPNVPFSSAYSSPPGRKNPSSTLVPEFSRTEIPSKRTWSRRDEEGSDVRGPGCPEMSCLCGLWLSCQVDGTVEISRPVVEGPRLYEVTVREPTRLSCLASGDQTGPGRRCRRKVGWPTRSATGTRAGSLYCGSCNCSTSSTSRLGFALSSLVTTNSSGRVFQPPGLSSMP